MFTSQPRLVKLTHDFGSSSLSRSVGRWKSCGSLDCVPQHSHDQQQDVPSQNNTLCPYNRDEYQPLLYFRTSPVDLSERHPVKQQQHEESKGQVTLRVVPSTFRMYPR